jgi:hypothetical protein
VLESPKQVEWTPKSILKQNGGAPINPVPESKVTIPGTDIETSIFGQPALDVEPYVVANPFTSPPLSASSPTPEPFNEAPLQTPATTEQPVQAAPSVANAVNIYENTDIRVIKLQ